MLFKILRATGTEHETNEHFSLPWNHDCDGKFHFPSLWNDSSYEPSRSWLLPDYFYFCFFFKLVSFFSSTT